MVPFILIYQRGFRIYIIYILCISIYDLCLSIHLHIFCLRVFPRKMVQKKQIACDVVQSRDISWFQPRPRRRIAAPRCHRWTHSQGQWTIRRYRDRSNSYPARWNPSRGETSSRHLSLHLPRIRDPPQLVAAHGDPFQGKEVAPLCTLKNFFHRATRESFALKMT